MKIFSSLKSQATSFLEQYKKSSPASYAAAQQAVGGLLILDGFVGIDNPLGGKKRSGILGSFIAMVLGILFIFAPNLLGDIMGVNKMTGVTTGTVVSVTRSQQLNTTNNQANNSSGACQITAEYTVDGQSYTNQSSIGSSSNCGYSEGQAITVNYDPAKPGSWSGDVEAAKTIFKFLPIIGAFVALSSFVTVVIRLLSIVFGWKLLQSGRALAASLPEKPELSSVINEVKANFKNIVFGGNALVPQAAQPIVNTAALQAPLQPQVEEAYLPPQSQQVSPQPPSAAQEVPLESSIATPAPQSQQPAATQSIMPQDNQGDDVQAKQD